MVLDANTAFTLITDALRIGASYGPLVEPLGNPMLRALLNVITGLPYGERLDLFGNFMKKQRPDIFEQMQKHTGSSAKVQADTIASIVQAKGQIVMEDLREFNSINRDGVFTEYDEPIDYRKNNRLRARYYLPGDDVGKESAKQSASDAAQVFVFNQYKINNADTGSNNSVYLDNRRNDFIRFNGPLGCPRPPDNLDQLVLPFRTLHEYNSDQPIRAIIQKRMFETMATDHVKRMLGQSSVALSDQIAGSILEDVVQLPPMFKPCDYDVQTLSKTRPMNAPWRSAREVYDADQNDYTRDNNFNPIYTM